MALGHRPALITTIPHLWYNFARALTIKREVTMYYEFIWSMSSIVWDSPSA